jgi:protein-tyrosine-phosphatase
MFVESNPHLVQRAALHAALAEPGRLAIVDQLLLADASPSELQARLSMSSNLLAHHIKVLDQAGVVRRTRSEGDRRRTYLRLNHNVFEALVPYATRQAPRVVFVCTQNSARSQLAAAIWNRRSPVPATSAGTHPAAKTHPGAIAAARRHKLPMRALTPRHIDQALAPNDLLIAVCDNAHEELPPDLQRMHWSVPDPVRASRQSAFDLAFDELTERIDRFTPYLQQLQPDRDRS